MKRIGIILAAGKGTRMKSLCNDSAKVCFKIFDKSMVEYVFETLNEAGIDDVITIVGHKSEDVAEVLGTRCQYAKQVEQKGTGHAVMQAIPFLKANTTSIIVCGDTPLLSVETLKKLIKYHEDNQHDATILEAVIENPKGYGRLLKEGQYLKKIIEEKDANEEQKKINCINTGVYAIETNLLIEYLNFLTPKNAQNEYYLTDIFGLMVKDKKKIGCVEIIDKNEFLGVNDRLQLAKATKLIQQRINNFHMLNGITIVDPATTYIGRDVRIGNDTTIYPNTHIYGNSIIGTNCRLGPNVEIYDSIIENDIKLHNKVVIEQTLLKANKE